MMLSAWQYALAAFVLTLCFTPAAIHYAKKMHLLDYPGERRSHQNVMPRGGGVIAVLVLLLLSLNLLLSQYSRLEATTQACYMAFIQAVFLVGLVGYFDDHADLSSRLKLIVQLIACMLALALLWLALPADSRPDGLLLLPLLLAMVWLTNLYNFMDGSHGLAAGQGVFSGLVFAWLFDASGIEPLTILSLLLAGVSAGFLLWNYG